MKIIAILLVGLSGLNFAAESSAFTAGKPQQLTSPDQVPEGLEKSDWQSIHAAHAAWQNEFRAVEGGWQAVNSGQQWTTTFDGRGFLAKPKDADWTWGLAFQSYGFGEGQTRIDGTPVVRAAGQRLTYQWSDGVEEWFVNDGRGLEHGFTVAERPAGRRENEALALTLATRGPLKPSLSADRQTVHFRDAATAPVLNYSGLKVWDADGTVLPSRFQVVGSEVRLLVEESTAHYPITIDPIAQQAYLKAGNNGAPSDDQFGNSVAVSGDTVVVGAPYEASSTTGVNSTPDESASRSGAAYVFTRSGTTWSQQAYLKASNTGMFDYFGWSVAVSGDTVVVGAYDEDSSTTGVNSTPNEGALTSGAAYVFTRSGTSWSQQAYLKASNPGVEEFFGYSVAVSGDTVVVGAYYAGLPSGSSGAAYVFTRSGVTWSQQASLEASNPEGGDYFGFSVALSGDTVVVGAPEEDSSTTGVNRTPNESALESGAAYVFTRSGTTWSQQAYLKASNTGAGDGFGSSVAVSGSTVVVGAYREDSSTTGVNNTSNNSASDSGAAYVFTRSGVTWSQQAYLKASNTEGGDWFGFSVAVAGDTVVVGARREDSSTTGVNSTPNEGASWSGAAYIFTRSGTTWSQQAYLKASNSGAGDHLGYSVAVSGDTVVFGAPYEDSSTTGVNSTPNEIAVTSGAAYVFTRSGVTWSQQVYLKASNTPSAGSGAGDHFGTSVAVSGDTVVVGASREDSSTTGVNSTPNESASDSGAAYVFTRSGTTWSQQAYLKASNTGAGDQFGTSVAVSGASVVVGANSEDSSTTGVNSTPNEGASWSGAAYVFIRSGTTWSQQAYLKASNTGVNDEFGISVAVSGDSVVVGAYAEESSTTGINSTPNNNSIYSGAAYVFTRSGTTWSQQAYLKASNTGEFDQFGYSVAVSGDTVVVGANNEASSTTGINSTPNNNGIYSGAAYVFTRSGTTWSQQAYLKASNTGEFDQFGCSVAVGGNTLVVGAYGEDSSTSGVNNTSNNSASDSGAAYVFTRSGTTWSQQAYLKASNPEEGDYFGVSVAVSGDTVVVGANNEASSTTGINSTPNNNSIYSGAAYVFTRSGTTWSQQAYLKASNTGEFDQFGASVAVSGDTVVVGANQEDSSTTGVNSTPNEDAADSGAAYVFDLNAVAPLPEIAIQRAGADIATNTTQATGPFVVGASSDLVFTILNTGPGALTLTGTPKVAVTGSSDFTVTTEPASPISGPSGSTTFTVRFTPSSIGSKNAVLSIPNNDANENPFTINLSGSGVTAVTAFNSAISANSSLTGSNALPAAIPFGDGVENLLKYAFNMNLSGPDSRALVSGTGNAGLPAIGLTGTGPATMLRVEYLRRKGSGLIYTPKRSSTLSPGSFVAMSGTPVVTSIDANWERVVVQESANPATLPKSFAIVEVSLP